MSEYSSNDNLVSSPDIWLALQVGHPLWPGARLGRTRKSCGVVGWKFLPIFSTEEEHRETKAIDS